MPLLWTPTATLTFDQNLELFYNQVFNFEKKIQMPLLLNAVVPLARDIKSNLQYQHSNKQNNVV